MKFVWPVLLVFFRSIYLVYSLWCLLFPVLLLCLLCVLWTDTWDVYHFRPEATWVARTVFAGFAVLVLGLVFIRRKPGDPNPFQSAFMSWFGTLRWFWNTRPAAMVALGLPSGHLVENPGGYRTTGRDQREILSLIEPGDILLRGYRGYVDGALIRRSSHCSEKGFQPGWFTHVALYVGPLGAQEQAVVPPLFANNPGYFDQGPQMVVHSMAKGVHTEDILTFCRCDYLAVVRIKPQVEPIAGKAGERAQAHKRSSALSEDLSDTLEKELLEAHHFDHALAVKTAKLSALEKIGEQYDFDCSDTTRFHRFSCAELVYYCYRGIRTAIDLQPRVHGLYPLGALNRQWAILKRVTITPDDFYDLVAQGTATLVWQDTVSRDRKAREKAAP